MSKTIFWEKEETIISFFICWNSQESWKITKKQRPQIRTKTRDSVVSNLSHETIYSRLSLSRSPMDYLEYFEISLPRYIRFAELRKTVNRTNTFNRLPMYLTPKLEIYWKYCGEEEKLLLFSTIFCCLLVDPCFKQGPDFHFEISGYSR